MKQFSGTLTIALTLGLIAVSAQSIAAQPGARWTLYRNDSGTTAPFPTDVFSIRAGEGVPRGEEFTSADGRARAHFFTIKNERNESPARFIARVIVDDRKLTYERVARGFFVFSAPENGRVLYRRCNFAHDRLIHCLDLRYPLAEKRAWDQIVTRMSLGLRPR